MSRRFLVHEFAAHAGVTVKAPHLYDRLRLLVPVRSGAGQRIYTTTDYTGFDAEPEVRSAQAPQAGWLWRGLGARLYSHDSGCVKNARAREQVEGARPRTTVCLVRALG